MRLREIRISGFRAVPVSAHVELVNGARGRTLHVQWSADAMRLRLPTSAATRRPMLSAIMGANSAGKSSLLLALNAIFGPAVKLDPAFFHGGQCDAQIVIEMTLVGEIQQATDW